MRRARAALPALLLLLAASCRTTMGRDESALAGLDQTANGAAPTFALAGYLPDSPTTKTWVTIQGGRIAAVSASKPTLAGNGLYLETEDWLFPGMINLHDHPDYDFLPLWDRAKGQFLNRFEWRWNFPPYKTAVTFNMTPIRGTPECLATRYAELKALTGGTTVLQGLSSYDTGCASGFALRGVETPSDLEDTRATSVTDLVEPNVIGASVFQTQILPRLGSGDEEADPAATYTQAYEAFASTAGVTSWLTQASQSPPSAATALALLLGDPTAQGYSVATPDVLTTFDQSAKDAAAAATLLSSVQLQTTSGGNGPVALQDAVQGAPWSVAPGSVAGQMKKMAAWLVSYAASSQGTASAPSTGGAGGGSGYTAASVNNGYGAALLDDAAASSPSPAASLLADPAVLALPAPVRDYVAYETRTRGRIADGLADGTLTRVIAHLAEGRRDDPYNQTEFTSLQQLGLERSGLILIHGVGMSAAQMQAAAADGLSLVWSPFSNLLLYGQTLDVQAALAAGLNVTLGTDWGPSGSKTLLDELKIARQYLDQSGIAIDNRTLVAMATVNGAKALGADSHLGAVAPGFDADLLVIHRTAAGPYDAVVAATQADVRLVVAQGQPRYGDADLLNLVAVGLGEDPSTLEAVTPAGDSCGGLGKVLRLGAETAYDQTLRQADANLQPRRYASIRRELTATMAAFASQVQSGAVQGDPADVATVAPIYDCEDQAYATRFASFISSELAQDAAQRATQRTADGLTDGWSPLGQ